MSLCYVNHPAVSNSNFTELERASKAQPQLNEIESLEDALKFGSLVDAMLTARHTLDEFERSVLDDRGRLHLYTRDQWDLALIMAKRCFADPLLRIFIENAIGQFSFIRKINFIHDGESCSMVGKCKYDLLTRDKRTGIEFKALGVTSQNQFRESIPFFNYDRAGAYYIDLARIGPIARLGMLERYMIVGISKKTENIFKYVILPGDAMHQQGQKKWHYWAYQWLNKVQDFNITL